MTYGLCVESVDGRDGIQVSRIIHVLFAERIVRKRGRTMPNFKDFGICEDCKRQMMLYKGRCGTCWKKREAQGDVNEKQDD